IDIIKNGIDKTLLNLIKYKKVKSRENLIKPLKIRLQTQEVCDFYKKNLKFTGYLLEDFYKKIKNDPIEKLEKYKNK
ncbi:plasmid partition family protein, partial [Borreliella valaisiana]|uniref:plasmid partition family protein n=1 Tax=Borreliella valaisiana TaxID=62088 RepID=UPI001F3ED971